MPILNWYNSYSINNEEIDNHHKKLFCLFNSLYEVCVDKDKLNSYDSVINELVAYADYHFKAEEQYMKDTGYKGIDSHIMKHKYFAERTMQLKQRNMEGDSVPTSEVIIFLGNWLLKHVIEEDKRISL